MKFSQGGAEAVELGDGQSLRAALPQGSRWLLKMEDVAEIDEGVARHDEGELGLAGGVSLDDRD